MAHPVRQSCKAKGARLPEAGLAKHAAGLHDNGANPWQATSLHAGSHGTCTTKA
ncbi:Hypothetical protein EPM1_2210 [Stenotrophomonas maltophilia EPM1]|nr:Hypothetical protein EPM1_2210 [Stenotrophomonas maltophilia EPM1]